MISENVSSASHPFLEVHAMYNNNDLMRNRLYIDTHQISTGARTFIKISGTLITHIYKIFIYTFSSCLSYDCNFTFSKGRRKHIIHTINFVIMIIDDVYKMMNSILCFLILFPIFLFAEDGDYFMPEI